MSTSATFPDIGLAGWRELAGKALKGAPLDRLKTPTRDGYTIEPIYRGVREAIALAPARAAASWRIVQRIDHPDAAEANTLALADLEGGADTLDLVFAASPHARGYGIASADRDAVAQLIDGIEAGLVTFGVDAGAETAAAVARLIDAAEARGIAGGDLTIDARIDPIGLAARLGGSKAGLAAAIETAAAEAVGIALSGIAGTTMAADGRIWHEAGASRAETLAAMLATAVTYWRALEATGLDVVEAAGRIGFVLPVDQNQFSVIAEIRALRLLWARATSAAGIGPAAARIHAETSFRMLSRLDVHTNLMRLTLAAFAAGVGGADSVSVLPLSAALGLPDAFARRLSRNLQVMLIEESNLARVADPAAGSGRVEAETRALAESAWGIFREIEAKGGIAASLSSGELQARIADTAAAEVKDVARRRQPLTGVSEFPLIAEPEVAVIDLVPRPAEPAHLVETFQALACARLAEPFETLRETANALAPKVFLANLGAIADFTSRSAWAKNLFEAGGIEAISNDGFAGIDALVAAFSASGASAVCLASSDAVYATDAPAAIAALKAAGAGPIFLAGKPADAAAEAALKEAGVDRFAFAGIDVVAFLTEAQALIADR